MEMFTLHSNRKLSFLILRISSIIAGTITLLLVLTVIGYFVLAIQKEFFITIAFNALLSIVMFCICFYSTILFWRTSKKFRND
jgi:hypothetical protein